MSFSHSFLHDHLRMARLSTPGLTSLVVDGAPPEALAEPRFVGVREVPRSGVARLAGPNDGEVRHGR